MRKILLAAIAVIFAGGFSVANAADNTGPPDGLWETLTELQRTATSRRAFGQQVFLGLTEAAASSVVVDWGFTSNYVVVCLQEGVTANSPIYIRLGASNPATNGADFRDGADNLVAGQAVPMSGGGADGTEQTCMSHPWRTDGLTLFAGDSNTTATVDVTAY